MAKNEDCNVLRIQTVVLKVNIHCDGCRQEVKKLLLRVEGVYTVSVDIENQKVTVTGNVKSEILIKKLVRSGKHASLWSSQQKPNNQTSKTNTSNQQKQQQQINQVNLLMNKNSRNGKKQGSVDSGGRNDNDAVDEVKRYPLLENSCGLDQIKLKFIENNKLNNSVAMTSDDGRKSVDLNAMMQSFHGDQLYQNHPGMLPMTTNCNQNHNNMMMYRKNPQGVLPSTGYQHPYHFNDLYANHNGSGWNGAYHFNDLYANHNGSGWNGAYHDFDHAYTDESSNEGCSVM